MFSNVVIMQVPGINGGNSSVDCSHAAVRDH